MKLKALDMTASFKSMWFDSCLTDTVFLDKDPRDIDTVKHDWSHGSLPFNDETFDLAVFDPPHLTKTWAGSGRIAEKYGYLFDDWRPGIAHAFDEMFRVCKPNAIIVFKWNTRQIAIYEVLKCTRYKPLFGHTTTWKNKSTTIWALFVRPLTLDQ